MDLNNPKFSVYRDKICPDSSSSSSSNSSTKSNLDPPKNSFTRPALDSMDTYDQGQESTLPRPVFQYGTLKELPPAGSTKTKPTPVDKATLVQSAGRKLPVANDTEPWKAKTAFVFGAPSNSLAHNTRKDKGLGSNGAKSLSSTRIFKVGGEEAGIPNPAKETQAIAAILAARDSQLQSQMDEESMEKDFRAEAAKLNLGAQYFKSMSAVPEYKLPVKKLQLPAPWPKSKPKPRVSRSNLPIIIELKLKPPKPKPSSAIKSQNEQTSYFHPSCGPQLLPSQKENLQSTAQLKEGMEADVEPRPRQDQTSPISMKNEMKKSSAITLPHHKPFDANAFKGLGWGHAFNLKGEEAERKKLLAIGARRFPKPMTTGEAEDEVLQGVMKNTATGARLLKPVAAADQVGDYGRNTKEQDNKKRHSSAIPANEAGLLNNVTQQGEGTVNEDIKTEANFDVTREKVRHSIDNALVFDDFFVKPIDGQLSPISLTRSFKNYKTQEELTTHQFGQELVAVSSGIPSPSMLTLCGTPKKIDDLTDEGVVVEDENIDFDDINSEDLNSSITESTLVAMRKIAEENGCTLPEAKNEEATPLDEPCKPKSMARRWKSFWSGRSRPQHEPKERIEKQDPRNSSGAEEDAGGN